MSAPFTLREMLPSDGPALQRLMEDDPAPTGMMMTTCFLVDPYQAWTMLKREMVGVVAETPGVEGLVGAATVAFDTLQVEGEHLPSAFLENLKVHHAHRGRGLGTQLAQWRVAKARERFGSEGIILTGTSSDNIASQNTMRKWAKQFITTLRTVPQPPRSTPPRPVVGLSVRPAEQEDFEEAAARSNRFYASYNLYAPLTDEALKATLGEVYHYRVVVDSSGNLIAGAMLSERSRLMVDEVCNVPRPLLLANRMLRMLPPDYVVRLIEVGGLWFQHAAAGRLLWDSIRWEFRDRASSFAAAFDARSPLRNVLGGKPWNQPKVRLVLAADSPIPLRDERLVAGMLRG